MQAIRRTLFEAVVLGVAGVLVALAANGVRASGALKLTKNYFDKGSTLVEHRLPSAEMTGADVADVSLVRRRTARSATASAEPAGEEHLEHGFQKVSLPQAVDIFNDSNTKLGVNVFVDARRDDAYEEGHIPGAIQADHYQLENHIDNLLNHAEGAEKIIVYCNGGKCEDSVFLCNELLEFEIPYDNIYLFGDGWKAWVANNLPIATGRDGE